MHHRPIPFRILSGIPGAPTSEPCILLFIPLLSKSNFILTEIHFPPTPCHARNVLLAPVFTRRNRKLSSYANIYIERIPDIVHKPRLSTAMKESCLPPDCPGDELHLDFQRRVKRVQTTRLPAGCAGHAHGERVPSRSRVPDEAAGRRGEPGPGIWTGLPSALRHGDEAVDIIP